MKTGLLIFLLMASVNLVFSQPSATPCVTQYKLNNGGGNCPDLNGFQATGSVTLTFDGTVDPNFIPMIVRVDSVPGGTVPGVFFGPGKLNNNGTVTYCYYLGPNNTNNLQGRGEKYNFVLSYSIGGQLIPCGSSNIPLPVNFKSFNAARSGSKVTLKWETVTEINNSGFALQRNTNNNNWQTITVIKSKAIDGNSDQALLYNYNDLNATQGISQYRIQQIDIDGKSKFSEIRAVRGEAQRGETIVYPNPSYDGRVNVVLEDIEGVRNVALMDISGRMIRQWKVSNGNTIFIDNLAPGLYSLRIVSLDLREQSFKKILVAGTK